MVVFTWASWNGATYYIDVFGRRMEKELEQLRREVSRMTKSPDLQGQDVLSAPSPVASPAGPRGLEGGAVQGAAKTSALDLGPPATGIGEQDYESVHRRHKSEDSGLFTSDTEAGTTDTGRVDGDGMASHGTSALELKTMADEPEDKDTRSTEVDAKAFLIANDGNEHHQKKS